MIEELFLYIFGPRFCDGGARFVCIILILLLISWIILKCKP